MDRGRDVMTTVEAINACIPLNNPELTGQLGSLSEIVHYKKGDCIYDIGDIQKKVYVLIEGMLRCYFIDESQTEMTDSFMTEKGMVANSVEIFVGKETPSVIGVEVLNETTVLEIPVQAVFDLMQQYPRMAKLYVRCLHQALEFQNEIDPQGCLQILLNNQDKANYPLDSEVEEKSMEILLPLMADNSADFLTINKESWQNTADWLLKMGIITKAADIDALVTDIPQ